MNSINYTEDHRDDLKTQDVSFCLDLTANALEYVSIKFYKNETMDKLLTCRVYVDVIWPYFHVDFPDPRSDLPPVGVLKIYDICCGECRIKIDVYSNLMCLSFSCWVMVGFSFSWYSDSPVFMFLCNIQLISTPD